MRIGTSRADKLGFMVFILMAALLAVLLITTGGEKTTVASTDGDGYVAVASESGVLGFAALGSDVEAVETTPPIAMPDPEPEIDITPLTQPVDAAPFSVSAVANSQSADAMADDASVDDASVDAMADDEADEAASTADSSDDAAAPAPAADAPATAASAPEPTATAVPNPQAPATAEPTATAVPNPQLPEATATPVPNPQAPAAGAPANPPAAAPAGGTFTHTLTAIVSQPTLYTSPGGSAFIPTFNGQSLPPVNPTVFGNPLVYRVLAGSPDDPSGWAQVYVPARPNGTRAWVQTSQFRWGSSNRLIRINVSTNTVTVFEGSNVLLSTAAVTGKGSSPTPIANGWVEEIMAGPSAAYGPRLISLGIFSEALNSFGGGVPKVALHGTNNPSLMGQYASNGCIRVPNDVISQIAGMMPLGSKVEIVR